MSKKCCPFSNKYKTLAIIWILASLALASSASFAGTKGAKSPITTEDSSTQNALAAGGEKLTIWKILKMNDWLFIPFVLITASGIMIITFRALYERREKVQARTLLQRSIHMNDLRAIEQMIRVHVNNRGHRLFQQLFNTFKKTREAGPLVNDINQFLAEERQLFETFQRVLSFLSDSAGALGLLGTVWGIFVTFHTGNLDGPMILRGMSVALITTLTGLVISLLLNLGGTGVFSMFNNQLNLLAIRAEELRQIFLYIETKKPAAETKPERPAHAGVAEPHFFNSYPEEQVSRERLRQPIRNRQPEPMMKTADVLY